VWRILSISFYFYFLNLSFKFRTTSSLSFNSNKIHNPKIQLAMHFINFFILIVYLFKQILHAI
jgi:hypothetical protein